MRPVFDFSRGGELVSYVTLAIIVAQLSGSCNHIGGQTLPKNAVQELTSDPCTDSDRVGAQPARTQLKAGRPLLQQMPTERELNAAIARHHLEALRAIFGDDDGQLEEVSRLLNLTPPVPRVIIEEELLGG